MQTVTLNNGVEMPILGLGVYQLTEPGECERVVSGALELGYRSIDTAASYRNEEAVGRAIAASGIPRDELFITSKVWIQDAGEKPARAAFERSLERLGLDYLDLYLIHQPMGDVYGSWRALENINKEGLSRAVGVSNFYPDRLVDLILHNEITPAVNQVETHPFHQQVEAQKVMQEYNVQIESWGPFAEGKNDLFTNPTLTAIAEEHGRSVAQVVLRWLIQRGVVVIPKSARRERLEENISVFDFTLSDAQMADISTLDTGSSLFIDHNDVSAVTLLSGVKFNT